jgi:hypothetical protein
MYKEKLLEKQVTYLTFFILILTLFFIGSSMNFVAVMSNGGKMPVKFDEFEFESVRHFSFVDCAQVEYCYLTDIFPIGAYIFSIGDFIIIISMLIEIILVVKIFKVRREIKKISRTSQEQ